MLPVLVRDAAAPGSAPADACCEACATARVPAQVDVPPAGTITQPTALRRPLPVLEPATEPGIGIVRSGDRRIAFGGLVVAAIYLALAAVSLLPPLATRLGSWLPVHLALAGAATTAIAAVLPFFTAALVVAPPARPAVRIAGIVFVAAGALAVVTVRRFADGQAMLAALAGGTFLAGLGFVGLAAFGPIRAARGPRRRLVEGAYALALGNVVVGATIAILLIGGNVAVGSAWGNLKPAHVWLNLVGFASLVIVATLLHLAPTIAGARIRSRASGRAAVLGLAAGAPIVAAGYVTGLDLIARVGAGAVVVGAIGIAAHGASIHFDQGRGRWTTDAGWHRLASGALLAGQAWFGFGLAVAASRVLMFGAAPAGWSLPVIVGPLVIGGVAQILVGAMTHLLPTIGPGDPTRHAAQRRLMGRGATVRLVLINAGAAFVTLGFGPAASDDAGLGSTLVRLGLACAVVGIGASLSLFAFAARRGPAGRLTDYGASFIRG